jgi:hypothetical protein
MKELFLFFAIAFVLSLVFPLVNFLRSRRRFSGERTVVCPETHHAAKIQIDAARAAKTGLLGEPDFKVKSCDRWGGPVGHCHEGCVEENAPALEEPSSVHA